MRSTIQLSPLDNLLVQSYSTIALLFELKNAKFLSSEYFKNLKIEDELSRYILQNVDIDNQGLLLITFYVLLVIPKEKFEEIYKNDFNELNTFINKVVISKPETNYKDDIPNVNYIRHIRNAIAHCKVKFEPTKTVTFFDEDKKTQEKCKFTIPLKEIGEIITKLQKAYINFLKSKVKSI